MEHMMRRIFGDLDGEWLNQEEAILILLCRSFFNHNAELDLQDIISSSEEVCYERLIQLCRNQRLLPQMVQLTNRFYLYERMNQNQKYFLKIYHMRQKLQYKLYRDEIVNLFDRFHHAGVNAFTFKGIVYLEGIYPESSDRQIGDIDLCVPHSDISAAINVLYEAGYRPCQEFKDWPLERFADESYMSVHVAQFQKEEKKVEIHAATYYYSGLNLLNVLNRSVVINDGIRIPTIEDSFLIACAHAWHHFPIRRFQMSSEQNQIRQMIDVLFCYRKLAEWYTDEEIRQIAEENNIRDIVDFILNTAVIMLDYSDCKYPLKTYKWLWEWSHDNKFLSLWFRYLRRQQSVEIMRDWFSDNLPVLEIEYETVDSEIRYCDSITVETMNDGACWPHNILETTTLEFTDISIPFKVSWNEDYLFFRFKDHDKMKWNSNQDQFNYFASYFVFRISSNSALPPKLLILQILDDKLRGYRWPEGEEWRRRTICYDDMLWEKNGRDYLCKLPWEWFDLKKRKPEDSLYFDLQARICSRTPDQYTDVMWLAGNQGTMWIEYKNSYNLAKAILKKFSGARKSSS